MPQTLTINSTVRRDIARVKRFADKHRLNESTVVMAHKKEIPAPGVNFNYVVVIPQNHRCVYTVEEHPRGWCHHLSVRLIGQEDPKAAASPEAVRLIANEFGMQIDEQWNGLVGLYPIRTDNGVIVNLYAPLE